MNATSNRRAAIFALFPLVLGFLVFSPAVLFGRGQVEAQAQSPGRRWEYAELSTVQPTNGSSTYRWEDSYRAVQANGYIALSNKIGVIAKRDDSTSVLNGLGTQGWELVSQSQTAAVSNNAYGGVAAVSTFSWTLKRPR